MSYHEALANAEAVIAASQSGDYDDGLGISPLHRALLHKVNNTSDPLTDTDLHALSALGEHELIVTADNAGRFDLTTPTNGDTP